MKHTSIISMHAMKLLIAKASGGNAPVLDSRVVSSVPTPAQAPGLLLGMSAAAGGPALDIAVLHCAGTEDEDVAFVDLGGGTELGHELGAEVEELAISSPTPRHFFNLAFVVLNELRKLMSNVAAMR
ncbi:hypothetical protein RSOLAG1IB_10596 [Rhizoctonia solani AG-1 IB]|uniref:Uncharacterized protein n=1 Tax=Thanatephorus cucumeris (strain AG1-IB / isolate 7/3/14) TaxID=1108050 RepID=A0A0B7G394_THACB|nr:hypothetical protein RSOLAG1IB_10596 [Rhizoctonia solani AG-1 IB]